jgi:hypothetical protein
MVIRRFGGVAATDPYARTGAKASIAGNPIAIPAALRNDLRFVFEIMLYFLFVPEQFRLNNGVN